MKAAEYLKHRARICKKHRCGMCPLRKYDNIGVTGCQADYSCIVLEREEPDRSIEIVEKWAKENPPKTYLSVLLERLPNMRIEHDGTPDFCPDDVFKIKLKPSICDFIACIDCWKKEYKEEE